MLLAIDPGNVQSAYVLWDGSNVLWDGSIQGKGILPNEDMLELVDGSEADHLAIEMVESFGMAVGKEVFETVWWAGRFCQAFKGPHTRLYRKAIKLHLCQSPRAKDGNVRQALIDRLGPQGTKKAKGPTYGVSKDVWSALAVAVYWSDLQKEAHHA